MLGQRNFKCRIPEALKSLCPQISALIAQHSTLKTLSASWMVLQATSSELQATSHKQRATSIKRQAASQSASVECDPNHQAPSIELRDGRATSRESRHSHKVLRVVERL